MDGARDDVAECLFSSLDDEPESQISSGQAVERRQEKVMRDHMGLGN